MQTKNNSLLSSNSRFLRLCKMGEVPKDFDVLKDKDANSLSQGKQHLSLKGHDNEGIPF